MASWFEDIKLLAKSPMEAGKATLEALPSGIQSTLRKASDVASEVQSVPGSEFAMLPMLGVAKNVSGGISRLGKIKDGITKGSAFDEFMKNTGLIGDKLREGKITVDEANKLELMARESYASHLRMEGKGIEPTAEMLRARFPSYDKWWNANDSLGNVPFDRGLRDPVTKMPLPEVRQSILSKHGFDEESFKSAGEKIKEIVSAIKKGE